VRDPKVCELEHRLAVCERLEQQVPGLDVAVDDLINKSTGSLACQQESIRDLYSARFHLVLMQEVDTLNLCRSIGTSGSAPKPKTQISTQAAHQVAEVLLGLLRIQRCALTAWARALACPI